MYEQHWQLKRAPFDHDRSAESFFTGSLHGESLVKLKYLIDHGKGAASLVGASGTGKTHVLEMVRKETDSRRPVVHLLYPQLSPVEMVACITHELGCQTSETNTSLSGMDVLLRVFQARLRELTEIGLAPVILLDDAHLIEDRRVFQMLHQLMNFQQPGRSNFSLVLSGQPELLETLQLTEQFADRLAFHCILQSLTENETSDYIRHRLASAGRTDPIFDRSATKAIFELSSGVPRRINRLCDFALLVGFANQAQRISADQIEAVYSEITRSNLAA